MGEKRTRRQFTREFKQEAVRLVAVGDRSLTQMARKLGVRPDMLRQRKRPTEGPADAPRSSGAPGRGQLTSQDEEIRRLRRELAQVLGRVNRERLRDVAGPVARPGRATPQATVEHTPAPGTRGGARGTTRTTRRPASTCERRSADADQPHRIPYKHIVRAWLEVLEHCSLGGGPVARRSDAVVRARHPTHDSLRLSPQPPRAGCRYYTRCSPCRRVVGGRRPCAVWGRVVS